MENFIKFSKTILSTSLVLTSSLAIANNYQAEVDLNYIDNGITILDGIQPLPKTESFNFKGRYFFAGVDTSNQPLAEAAFLQKQSYINAGYTDWDIDITNGASGSLQNIGAGFYIPETMFYLGLQHFRTEYDGDDSENNTRFELGITPIDGLLLSTVHYEESDDYEANIHAKYVRTLAGDTSINLEAGYTDVEYGSASIYLAADYYFNNQFSVGASVTDYEDGSDYSIRSRYFFNDKFAVSGTFTSDGEIDENAISIGASLRF